ncbi:hypothetical protein [Phormidium sp. CCY1219]|nr:hypothetical protein [Phormidium sp. CCY1219]MEB3828552.1 hypothetical protein [Phormidium sp. CCY1219]
MTLPIEGAVAIAAQGKPKLSRDRLYSAPCGEFTINFPEFLTYSSHTSAN